MSSFISYSIAKWPSIEKATHPFTVDGERIRGDLHPSLLHDLTKFSIDQNANIDMCDER